jgi:Membrane-associated phospholipid phosphatase
MRVFFLRQFFFLLPFLLLMLILVAPFYLAGEPIEPWYRHFRYYNKGVSAVFKFISKWGNLALLLPFALILGASVYRKSREGVQFVLSFALVQYALVMSLVHLLKFAVGAPRPFVFDQETLHPFSPESRFHSFPSGHTTEALGSGGPLAHRQGWSTHCFHAFLWGIVPGLVAYSRIFLGKHHPMDLLGGALLASLATGLLLIIMQGPPLWERLPFFRPIVKALPWLAEKPEKKDCCDL